MPVSSLAIFFLLLTSSSTAPQRRGRVAEHNILYALEKISGGSSLLAGCLQERLYLLPGCRDVVLWGQSLLLLTPPEHACCLPPCTSILRPVPCAAAPLPMIAW